MLLTVVALDKLEIKVSVGVVALNTEDGTWWLLMLLKGFPLGHGIKFLMSNLLLTNIKISYCFFFKVKCDLFSLIKIRINMTCRTRFCDILQILSAIIKLKLAAVALLSVLIISCIYVH